MIPCSMRIGGLPVLRLAAPVSRFLQSLELQRELCGSAILGIGNRHARWECLLVHHTVIHSIRHTSFVTTSLLSVFI